MKCPKDSSILEKKMNKGIEVDFCQTCKGFWLDHEELDQLEDKAYDEDEYKGTTIFRDHETKYKCPHCQNPLRQFQYRFYDLVLEHCPEKHGFWLDEGEDKRVLELMKKRGKDIKRSFSAEKDWANFMERVKSRSFVSKIKNLFRK